MWSGWSWRVKMGMRGRRGKAFLANEEGRQRREMKVLRPDHASAVSSIQTCVSSLFHFNFARYSYLYTLSYTCTHTNTHTHDKEKREREKEKEREKGALL